MFLSSFGFLCGFGEKRESESVPRTHISFQLSRSSSNIQVRKAVSSITGAEQIFSKIMNCVLAKTPSFRSYYFP